MGIATLPTAHSTEVKKAWPLLCASLYTKKAITNPINTLIPIKKTTLKKVIRNYIIKLFADAINE
jgi:ABC-type transporter MlaC component